MIHRLFLFFAIIFSLLSPATAQQSHSWVVKKISGTAWIAEKNKKAVRAAKGAFLQPGQTLSTNNRTRLTLARGKERMQVGSNSVLAIPKEKYLKRGKTLILQQAGSVQLAVNKKDVKHFSVQTPFLAAVVKGTQFTVTVKQKETQISVLSGKVEVANRSSGEKALLTAGQTASVNKSKGRVSSLRVKGKGKLAKVQKSKTKAALPAFTVSKQAKAEKARKAQKVKRTKSKSQAKSQSKRYKQAKRSTKISSGSKQSSQKSKRAASSTKKVKTAAKAGLGTGPKANPKTASETNEKILIGRGNSGTEKVNTKGEKDENDLDGQNGNND